MESKRRKPIPTSFIIAVTLFLVGCAMYMRSQYKLLSSLVIVLACIIGLINTMLIPSGKALLKNELDKKELRIYKNFALFYLKDRRIAYTKANFKKAITNKWLDVVTMFLLLGIANKCSVEERAEILQNILYKEDFKLFQVLLRGGFSGHFIVPQTKEHFAFETLKMKDSSYLDELMRQNITPDVVDKESSTLLFRAIQHKATKHIKVLIAYGATLEIQNQEGLTPLFFALKVGNIEACELLLAYAKKHKDMKKIDFKKLEVPLVLNAQKAQEEKDILLKLIESDEPEVLELLRKYFQQESKIYTYVETDVEVYARLSGIKMEHRKKELLTDKKHTLYTQEECDKDFFDFVFRKYRFGAIGKFKIDSIYKKPKYIKSKEEKCQHCKGIGYQTCSTCKGKGEENCVACGGRGVNVCSKCEGTLKIDCQTIKKYKECKQCRDGVYRCIKCDDKGMQKCRKCDGHGTKKCTCPEDMQTKCKHCDGGYVSVQGGMYRKCSKCKKGKNCTLCHNTGWVISNFKDKGFKCEVCDGQGKIPCTTCKGIRKIRCNKKFQVDCECGNGEEICPVCEGHKKVSCHSCNGTKMEPCKMCDGGVMYKNIALDYRGLQILREESIFSKNREMIYTKGILRDVADMVSTNHDYISEVYTVMKPIVQREDVSIANQAMQLQLNPMLAKQSKEDVLNIVEIIPLYYTKIVFEEKGGHKHECILINNKFFQMKLR